MRLLIIASCSPGVGKFPAPCRPGGQCSGHSSDPLAPPLCLHSPPPAASASASHGSAFRSSTARLQHPGAAFPARVEDPECLGVHVHSSVWTQAVTAGCGRANAQLPFQGQAALRYDLPVAPPSRLLPGATPLLAPFLSLSCSPCPALPVLGGSPE